MYLFFLRSSGRATVLSLLTVDLALQKSGLFTEAPENGKELSHSAHANGMNRIELSVGFMR